MRATTDRGPTSLPLFEQRKPWLEPKLRGAELELRSSPDGTRVQLRLPAAQPRG